jgi:trimethylamine--corrinoid protein Co-methyltransferase
MLHGSLTVLTPAEIETIHDVSMRLLENVGVDMPLDEARAALQKAGARVSGSRVFLPRRLVEERVRLAPAEFTIHARNAGKNIIVGGSRPVFAPGYGAPLLMDYEVGARQPTLEDYENLTRLADALPYLDMAGHLLVNPRDVPADQAYLRMLHGSMRLSDKPFIGSTSGAKGVRASAEMAGIVFGGIEFVKERPVMIGLINTLSPLAFAAEMLEALVELARWRQPILIAAMVQAGATGPVTLAGVLAQQNAELLAGITLAECVSPGTPVVYGSTSTSTDMSTAGGAIGSPEYPLMVTAHGQMARFYGLPSRSGGCLTDSQVADAQAGLESMQSMLTTVNAGINFVLHAAGILGSFLTFSYEKMMIDHDICGMMRRYQRGIPINADELAYDVIAGVGPGGNFLMEDHTLQHFRKAFYRPALNSRDALPAWEEKGKMDMARRANLRWKRLLAEHVPPALDEITARQLTQYVETHL